MRKWLKKIPFFGNKEAKKGKHERRTTDSERTTYTGTYTVVSQLGYEEPEDPSKPTLYRTPLDVISLGSLSDHVRVLDSSLNYIGFAVQYEKSCNVYLYGASIRRPVLGVPQSDTATTALDDLVVSPLPHSTQQGLGVSLLSSTTPGSTGGPGAGGVGGTSGGNNNGNTLPPDPPSFDRWDDCSASQFGSFTGASVMGGGGIGGGGGHGGLGSVPIERTVGGGYLLIDITFPDAAPRMKMMYVGNGVLVFYPSGSGRRTFKTDQLLFCRLPPVDEVNRRLQAWPATPPMTVSAQSVGLTCPNLKPNDAVGGEVFFFTAGPVPGPAGDVEFYLVRTTFVQRLILHATDTSTVATETPGAAASAAAGTGNEAAARRPTTASSPSPAPVVWTICQPLSYSTPAGDKKPVLIPIHAGVLLLGHKPLNHNCTVMDVVSWLGPAPGNRNSGCDTSVSSASGVVTTSVVEEAGGVDPDHSTPRRNSSILPSGGAASPPPPVYNPVSTLPMVPETVAPKVVAGDRHPVQDLKADETLQAAVVIPLRPGIPAGRLSTVLMLRAGRLWFWTPALHSAPSPTSKEPSQQFPSTASTASSGQPVGVTAPAEVFWLGKPHLFASAPGEPVSMSLHPSHADVVVLGTTRALYFVKLWIDSRTGAVHGETVTAYQHDFGTGKGKDAALTWALLPGPTLPPGWKGNPRNSGDLHVASASSIGKSSGLGTTPGSGGGSSLSPPASFRTAPPSETASVSSFTTRCRGNQLVVLSAPAPTATAEERKDDCWLHQVAPFRGSGRSSGNYSVASTANTQQTVATGKASTVTRGGSIASSELNTVLSGGSSQQARSLDQIAVQQTMLPNHIDRRIVSLAPELGSYIEWSTTGSRMYAWSRQVAPINVAPVDDWLIEEDDQEYLPEADPPGPSSEGTTPPLAVST